MIKINKSIIIIISLSLFIYIGCNVLTAEAEKDCSSISEPDDDFYCKEFDWGAFSPDKQTVDELCDASEDYAKNPTNCDIAYDLVEKQDKNLKKDLGEACDQSGGKMVNGYCDVESSDGKQADKFYKEQTKLGQEQIEDGRNTVTTDAEEANLNNIDSDNDGIYDDEELSEEEEKELAKHKKEADEMTDKEKKKLDKENQQVIDEWVKDELKATEDELRAMTASTPNYDKQEETNEESEEEPEAEEDEEDESEEDNSNSES